MLVIVGQRMTLVTANDEFDLGVEAPNDQMVRELDGTRVIGASVVKTTMTGESN